jgi:hypothetical protein
MIGRGNRSTLRKPVPVTLCPPQTPHVAWTRTRAAAVGSQQITASATALPKLSYVGFKVLAAVATSLPDMIEFTDFSHVSEKRR